MQKHILLEAEGYNVYVDLINSKAGKYINALPYVASLVKETLRKKSLEKRSSHILENDLGRSIGQCYTVQTTEKDTVFYALPLKNTVMQRFVRHRQPEQTSMLTILLEQDDEGDFEVIDTWLGMYCPPFPGDAHAKDDSLTFWERHAVIADLHAIQQRTITTECPY